MKVMILLLLCCYYWPSNAQQGVIYGIVSVQNSETNTGRRLYVANAQVEDDFNKAQPTLTNADGKFLLVYTGIPDKRVVSFQVKKHPMEVVNIASLSAVIGQSDTVRISMAYPDSINEYRKRIYKVGKTQAEKRLEQLIVQKVKELDNMRKENSARIQESRELERQLAALEEKRKQIEDQARELANKYAPVNLDDMSPALRQAFLFFQAGKLDSALLILQDLRLSNGVSQILAEREKLSNLKDELDQRGTLLGQSTKSAKQALRIKADLHKTLFEFDSTAACFDLLLRLDSADPSILYDYGQFLTWQNERDKAIYLYEKALLLERAAARANPSAAESSIAEIQNNLGSLYRDKRDIARAEFAFKEALDIFRRLAKIYPSAFVSHVAMTQNNLGVLYSEKGDFTRSEDAYQESLEIYVGLARVDPPAYEPGEALTLNNLGAEWGRRNDFDRGELALKKALEIRRRLAKTNPLMYEPDVAMTQNNLGILYRKMGDSVHAELALKESLQIYERLAKVNPLAYEQFVARTQDNLGAFYLVKDNLARAEPAFREGLEALQRLAQTDPAVYEPDMAVARHNLGILLVEKGDFAEAEQQFVSASKIWGKWMEIYPLAYNSNWKQSIKDLIFFYSTAAWYMLLNREYRQAELLALKGLGLDSTQAEIKPNLAHALLLQGRFKEAMKIYTELKPMKDEDGRSYTDICLEDLNKLEKVKVTQKDFDRVRDYLKN